MDFGEYAEVHDEPSPTDSMKSCTCKYLGIGPKGNIQVSYKLINLTNEKTEETSLDINAHAI